MAASVLVTGGSGFIGSWVLRELLDRGLRPVIYDLRPHPERWKRIVGDRAGQMHFVSGTLLDRQRLAQLFLEQRISHVIHLAAMLTPDCQRDPWAGCQVNVLGSVALFEAARSAAGQLEGFSWASSLAVYGPEVDEHQEGTGPGDNRPASFYGAFKKAVELIAEQYWLHWGIASLGLRPHVVYGPERDGGLTAGPSLAARAAAAGEPFQIGYVGRAGYDYVEDVARGFVGGALETPAGAQVVDLPSPAADTQDLIAAIQAVVPEARITAEGPHLPQNQPPAVSLISDLLTDWKTTSIADGMRRTIEFYQPAAQRTELS